MPGLEQGVLAGRASGWSCVKLSSFLAYKVDWRGPESGIGRVASLGQFLRNGIGKLLVPG